MLRFLFKIMICLGIFLPLYSAAHAQVSVNVNIQDPAYRDIDKLVGHGLVKKIIMGQRPFSRREFARITAEAMVIKKRLTERMDDPELSEKKRRRIRDRMPYIEVILTRLQIEFREELVQLGALEGETNWYSAHPLEKVQFDVTVTDSPPRGIANNGIGEIQDAVINPLVQYRQGRNLVDGGNLYMETVSWVRATDYFAAMARPRFQLSIPRPGQANNSSVYAQNLYGKFAFHNFEIEFGRDNIIYGQGKEAGLLLSNNPRGLDMVKISNDLPYFFPWIFKYLGANKMSFFWANLGPEQNFPYAYLVGYKWNLQPLSFFELGFALTAQSGGEGSPQASFGERVVDILPNGQETQVEVSNKLAGVDFRFRIPPARGLEIYGEWIFDDMDTRRLNSIFKEDSAYVAGIYLPRVTNSGTVDLRLEYHRTGIRFYQHSQFVSGYVENQNIIGDNLGPDGNAGYIWVDWDINPENLITFHGAVERRSNDFYINLGEPFIFVKVSDLPKEWRYRFLGKWQHRMKELPVWFQVDLGLEQVQNFNFAAGDDRINFLGRFFVNLDLDRITRFPRKK